MALKKALSSSEMTGTVSLCYKDGLVETDGFHLSISAWVSSSILDPFPGLGPKGNPLFKFPKYWALTDCFAGNIQNQENENNEKKKNGLIQTILAKDARSWFYCFSMHLDELFRKLNKTKCRNDILYAN